MADAREAALAELFKDRELAHRVLFAHRHTEESAPAHGEVIRHFHSKRIRYYGVVAFRGFAKSTIGEEGIVIGASFRDFHYALLCGSTLDRACERLHAIRREFERNEDLIRLFGDQRGVPWGDDQLELASGVAIQAIGRGQALRGTKKLIKRPDFILGDDIEDKEEARKEEGRRKLTSWFFGDLLPAGDEPTMRVRLLANDLHPDCLINQLDKPRTGWIVQRFPWEHLDLETGERKATWPQRYPLDKIDQEKGRMMAMGRMDDYNSERMCRSDHPEDKIFRPDMIRVEPRPHAWEACFAMIDPARTVHAASADTGAAVWSWIGGRLVVWEGWARKLLPDEIVKAVFDIHEAFHPVALGVEKTGLAEWLMQPLRLEMAKRGILIPLKGVEAPRGKIDFIAGLQPRFASREVAFAKELPDLRAQLLSFPAGRIDAPNALAYAQKLGGGLPIYEDFSRLNIADELEPMLSRPAWLALNATPAVTTAVLVQQIGDALRIFADWVREGEPGAVLPEILKEARLEAGQEPRLAAPPPHWERYLNAGLLAAARRAALEVKRGAPPERGRAELRKSLKAMSKGMPQLLVAARACWVLNGFAGGYARALDKQGVAQDWAEDGPYKTLMEGLEGWAGMLAKGEDDGARGARYLVRRDGTPVAGKRGP